MYNKSVHNQFNANYNLFVTLQSFLSWKDSQIESSQWFMAREKVLTLHVPTQKH